MFCDNLNCFVCGCTIMSDTIGFSSIENSNSSLHRILQNCVSLQSSEWPAEDYNDVVCSPSICDYYKMISTNSYSTSGNISSSSFASDESFGDNILEENGRISLAYENLRAIPRRIAEKFAVQTKCLDLSYNNFQNLSFLSFFEELHTLILDRNSNLNANTLPFLPNLKILWINNCEISNLTEWIHRIQTSCPTLEQLSAMGNPDNKSAFNYCSLTSHSLTEPTSFLTDYREYILLALPNLEYLDGVGRCSQSVKTAETVYNHTVTSSAASIVGNGSTVANGGHSANDQSKHASSRKTSVSFKDLFRLRRRKKSYQSSSTN